MKGRRARGKGEPAPLDTVPGADYEMFVTQRIIGARPCVIAAIMILPEVPQLTSPMPFHRRRRCSVIARAVTARVRAASSPDHEARPV